MGRVLVVEDEALVAMLLEDWLDEFGFESHVCATLNEAIAFVNDADLEFAILDVNLGTGLTYPAADALIARGIPFAFATGYGEGGIHGSYANSPVLHKPFQRERLKALTEQLRLGR